MGSEHTDFAALDAAVIEALAESAYGRILSLIAANLSESGGACHLLRYTAEALMAIDRAEDAAELYGDLARYAADINRPLDALMAIKALQILDEDEARAIREGLVNRYSIVSSLLERGTTPVALPTDGAVMVEPIGETDAPLDVRIENALLACGAITHSDREPLRTSPIPLLSDLDSEDFVAVARQLIPQTHDDGHQLISEGEPVAGIWWLARGGLRVQSRARGARALNGPNIMVGLEAFLDAPAEVTVTCMGRCDTVFLGGDALHELLEGRAELRHEIGQLVARYELHQAVSRCDLFRQLPIAKHAHLLAKFSAHRVPAGQALVRQGAPTPGLFLVTHGRVELRVDNGAAPRVIAQLDRGDLVGLMGTDEGERSRLSAVATEPAGVLFVDVDGLREAVDQHPDAGLVLDRLRQDRQALLSVALLE